MDKNLRIGMLIGRFYPVEGGAEVQCRRLSNELRARNHSVFVLTQSLPHTPSFEEIDGLPVYRVGLPFNGIIGSLSYVFGGLFWILRNRNIVDLLHVHMASSPAVLAAIAGRILGKPVMLKIAGSRMTGDLRTSAATWYGRMKLDFLQKHIRNIVCPSREIEQELLNYGFAAGRITVIPNGVDTSFFTQTGPNEKKRLRQELALEQDALVAVYCGRLQAGKGLDLLLAAWPEISRGERRMLLIVGDGPLGGRLRNDYGRLESVRFTGWEKDTLRYLQAADIFVLPSLGEGMSNALIEAMSCGLTCVATEIGGNTEVITHGCNGILVAPGKAAALIEGVNRVANDPPARESIGRAARSFVEENLSLGIIAEKYEMVYHDMLTGDAKGTLRFEFGKNWGRFSVAINDARIRYAEDSFTGMLGVDALKGKTFLDIGCGSGLMSLAAVRAGALRVHSFDYDERSVETTRALKERFCPGLSSWTIGRGDALDAEYLRSLGPFDIVYSWGVLHHTGHLWQALENVTEVCGKSGKLYIALYNDQGIFSAVWKLIKIAYNCLPGIARYFVVLPVAVRLWGPATVRDMFRMQPFKTWREYRAARGMSPWRDVIDWVGGYPFEVARPLAVINFFKKRGFALLKEKSCGRGHGNNEFVFEKRRA